MQTYNYAPDGYKGMVLYAEKTEREPLDFYKIAKDLSGVL